MAFKLFEKTALILGHLKTFFLAAFFAIFPLVNAPNAYAQSASDCGGENLLFTLKADNPALYRTVLDEAERAQNADSILWKIEKVGQPVSYLFGTMHLADPEITTLSDQII